MTTRKNQKGGSFFGSKPKNTRTANLKARQTYNLAHSKSRVANYLKTPGSFQYTNKQAIEERYEKALADIQSMDKPKETFSALQQLSASLDRAITSQAARETGAVVITVPVGIAQLALKALRLFLSFLIVVFIDLPLGFLSGSPAVNLAAAVAPNTKFNTTAAMYQRARQFTGADGPMPAVVNY